jgi:hypothetical protein
MLDEIKKLIRHAEEYIDTNIELNKLKAVNSATSTMSYIIAMLVITCAVFLFVFMLFIALSLWIGHALGRTEYGFFIMSAVMAIFCMVLYAFRESLLKKPLGDHLIKKILE